MRLRTRLERLERRLQPSRDCPVCGWPPDMVRTTILFKGLQKGRMNCPPDLRPICLACKLPEGGIALLWAEVEERGEAPDSDPDRDDAS
jgi:hypothetical protein